MLAAKITESPNKFLFSLKLISSFSDLTFWEFLMIASMICIVLTWAISACSISDPRFFL